MAGAAGIFAPAFADETAAIDLSQKPVDTPTLAYLKDNNILIPQKDYKRDADGNLVKENNKPVYIDGEPIASPGSAYTITTGTETDHTFDYTTADSEGNLTHNYYKIDLGHPELDSGSIDFGTSENIKWEEVSAPIESTDKRTGTVEVNLPDSETKYYKYTYTQPDNYELAPSMIDNTLDSENATNKVFEGFTDGAINNYGGISSITGDFIGNSANSELGGAIYNDGTIGDITGDFIGNSVSGYNYGSGSGGAIYNSGQYDGTATIGNITGDFIGNSANNGSGGAIYNSGQYYGTAIIGDIMADFIGNSARDSGGAIHSSYGVIGDIMGVFIGNSAGSGNKGYSRNGGAIGNFTDSSIGNIIGDFINNSVNAYGALGGAISNTGTILSLIGDFIGNSASGSVNGGLSGGASGGAIYNEGTIDKIVNSSFINNSARIEFFANGTVRGGAIYNTGEIDKIVNSSFINNSARVIFEGGTAQGGAIYSTKHLNIIADNGVSEFTGNYVQVGNGEKDYQAIYVGSTRRNYDSSYSGYYGYSPATLTLTAKNNGKIVMNDKISGDSNGYIGYWKNYQILIDGDSTGTVYLNNDIESNKAPEGFYGSFYTPVTPLAADISLSNTQLRLGVRDNVLDGNNLTLNSGTFNMVNNQVGISALNSLTVIGNTDFVADVDLANKEMDRFTATNYGPHRGNLNVVGMNLLSDANPDDEITAIYFAQPGLKNNVTHNGLEVPNEKYQNFEFYTPIYKYNVTYDKDNQYDDKGDGGYFLFTKGDKYIKPAPPVDPENPTITPSTPSTGTTGNPSDAFNPAVLSSPISSVAASQATINETFKYVFEHADAFTQLPSDVRTARINANKYALYDGASTDFNGNRGSLCYDHNNKAAWFRPYATFETMNLKNGPKVNATTYGSLAGFDTDFHEHKNGWHSVGTGYIGYNGSQLSYKGVDTTMNGGILGYTHTMYKGNFWTALTLSAGASVGESRTMYGKEEFTSLMAGVGSKTGYNFEFKEGKYILQPIMFMSYTFVNTFDYTNAAGVKINADPAHSIQLNPSIRFISNFKNGWQPYASVGMVWNVMNENNVTANNVRLPEMSMKPYVEYGVGVQRNWKDKFTAFGQAMLRNGGRNGIALTAGFRWALGKDTPQHNDKVQAPKTDRTVLKQLSPQQKMALTGKKNTTITSAKAVLKQL